VIALAAAVVVTLTPNPSHFGEPVTAHVQGGPAPSFKPYSVRSQSGDTYVLQCLTSACLPGPGPKVVKVGGTRLVILPRATEHQVAHPLRSFHRQTTPPPISYNIRPSLLRALLLGAVVLLLAIAVAIAWPLLRRLVPEPHDDRTPLQRALDLVRASLSRPPPDRRRALDLLARSVGREPASDEALELAWSRPDPEPKRVEQLVERVEREP
jgi:hypothetical protein